MKSNIQARLNDLSQFPDMYEIIVHQCQNCSRNVKYIFSKDLHYQTEPPFLCSEICLTEYARNQLIDEQLDDTEDDGHDCFRNEHDFT